MWLINTVTVKLEFFTPPRVPKYAILSHTWGEGEVTFQDFRDLEKARLKKGFAKIEKTCQIARDTELDYAWVDTCCIDKTSSAELSESINSMYNWYRHAEICYAYIDDWVPGLAWTNLRSIHDGDLSGENESRGNETEVNILDRDALEESDPKEGSSIEEVINLRYLSVSAPLRWFTRGWTLQELIAPKKMEFYDSEWKLKGSKIDSESIDHLSRITGIASIILKDGSERNLRGVCLGQRMCWAAFRETSRVEDIAYSLLGIFNINMPLLYGEGSKAFLRLQEEILKSSTDLSILAWSQDWRDPRAFRGIFSEKPREFEFLGGCHLEESQFSLRDEVLITNKGARIGTSLFEPSYESTDTKTRLNNGRQYLYLGCQVSGALQGIAIRNIQDFYVREDPYFLVEIKGSVRRSKAQTIYLARDVDAFSAWDYETALSTGLSVDLAPLKTYALEVSEAWPPGMYDHRYGTFLAWNRAPNLGFLSVSIKSKVSNSAEMQEILRFAVVCQCPSSTLSERYWWLGLIDTDQAAEFDLFTKKWSDLDPLTAAHELSTSFGTSLHDSKQELIVEDKRRGNRLCVQVVKVDNHRYSIKMVSFPTKSLRDSSKSFQV